MRERARRRRSHEPRLRRARAARHLVQIHQVEDLPEFSELLLCQMRVLLLLFRHRADGESCERAAPSESQVEAAATTTRPRATEQPGRRQKQAPGCLEERVFSLQEADRVEPSSRRGLAFGVPSETALDESGYYGIKIDLISEIRHRPRETTTTRRALLLLRTPQHPKVGPADRTGPRTRSPRARNSG